MKKNRVGRVIAALSATVMAAGVAVVGYSSLQIQSSSTQSAKDFLPAMQREWAIETITPQISAVALNKGTYLGIIQIPSLKMKVNLFEGTEKKSLSQGAGHYVKSVLPGESDNSVFAGHRDTVFASLGKIKIGAPIVITTKDGIFIYRVTGTRIVDKNDRTVIVPTESATLTLSTCYPFRFLGNAPQRFVVTGLMEEEIL